MKVITTTGPLVDLGEDAAKLVRSIEVANHVLSEVRKSMNVCDGQAGQTPDLEIEAAMFHLEHLHKALVYRTGGMGEVIDV